MNLKFWNGAALLLNAAIVFTLTACGSDATQKGSSETTNFIVIFTDEMQFSDLGCYGGRYINP